MKFDLTPAQALSLYDELHDSLRDQIRNRDLRPISPNEEHLITLHDRLRAIIVTALGISDAELFFKKEQEKIDAIQLDHDQKSPPSSRRK